LNAGYDRTLERSQQVIQSAKFLKFSSDKNDLRDSNVYIITVPTPIDASNNPDLSALEAASKLVGRFLKIGDVVIYESTVYPGATEEICVPILEQVSNLGFNKDFYCGYSPERINPGDKIHTLTNTVKITSGSTPVISKFVDELYQNIIDAGTWRAPTIKVAEAAKVIENSQRDLNIAFVNELSII
jgi:UDP-N-acetyl-D-galactosamine dehydrogenase